MARKALLVGINDYPDAPLRGCVTDVERMAAELYGRGWERDDIRLITDKRATTNAIRDRLDWLVSFATPGDSLVFHYSGHGTKLAYRDGLGKAGPAQDCICPVDFDWSTSHALTANDFAEMFMDIPVGVSFTWISDSCHSGNLARTVFCADFGTYRAPRSYPVPADIAWRNASAPPANSEGPTFARAVKHLHGVLLAGCKSEQTSADAFLDGEPCGAFTTALLRRLNEANGRAKPIETVVIEANEWLEANGFDQDPQCKGDPVHKAKPWLWVDAPLAT